MSEGTRSLCGREKGGVEGCKARDTLRRAPARQKTWIIKNNKNTISWKMSFVTSYRHANYCYSSHRNARWMRRGQFMQKKEEDDTQKRTHRPSTAPFAAFRGSTRQSCKDSAWQQYDCFVLVVLRTAIRMWGKTDQTYKQYSRFLFSKSQRDKLRQAFRESACQIQGSTQEQSCSSLLRVCLKLCLTFRTKEAIHRARYREFLCYNSSIWYTIFIKNSTFYLTASPTC